MLPFLRKNEEKPQDSGLSLDRTSDQPEQDDSGIEQCAQDLINAVHGHDVQGVAEAMKSAFTILENQPHDEGPHTYEAQNQLAGEGQE